VTDFFKKLEEIEKKEASLFVDNVAMATQDRRFLVGDPQEDAALTEVLFLNAHQAIHRAVTEISGETGLEALKANRKLHQLCRDFVEEHKIGCAETVYDMDDIIADAYGLIESICDIVGYVGEEEAK
jgi:hypothetical protein